MGKFKVFVKQILTEVVSNSRCFASDYETRGKDFAD